MGAFFEVDDAEFQAWAKRVEANIERDALKQAVQGSLEKVGNRAIDVAIGFTPVGETKYLVSQWFLANAGVMAIELYNNAYYAGYVENGHRTRGGGGWVPGQFFLRDTIAEIAAMMPSLITPGLTRALEGMLD